MATAHKNKNKSAFTNSLQNKPETNKKYSIDRNSKCILGQYGLHRARTLHWKPKNHKGDYIDLAAGSHPCTPKPAPYMHQLNTHQNSLIHRNSEHN